MNKLSRLAAPASHDPSSGLPNEPSGGTSGPYTGRYTSLVPAMMSQRILREDILSRVFDAAFEPIVVLQAPAGHGKSTALQQIRSESTSRGIRCGWLSLDESDNDSTRHATHLQKLLAQIFDARGQVALGHLEAGAAASRHQERSDWFVEKLDGDKSPITLFVDEFEVLSNRAILSFWRDFLLKLPAHVRVFIASRTLPDIGIPRLTVANRVLVLHAADLSFSLDEVQRFFSSAGILSMQDGDLEAVHRCTEGWPAAIQLFRLGLSRRLPSDALRRIDQYRPRELADYLTECVLEGLSPDTMRFLERTCILNRLGAQVCNALTGRSDSMQQLLRLEKLGLFVSPLDENHVWFRYHTLLATHLREQLLNQHHDKFRSLHRQASDWFYQNGLYEDAMHHAVAASNYSLAADIFETWSERLVSDGEMTITERWLDCIPLAEVIRRPLLKRRMAWALMFLNQRTKLFSLMGSDDPSDWYADSDSLQDLPVVAIAAICTDDMAKAFSSVEKVSSLGGASDRFNNFELAAAANLDAYRQLVIGDFKQSEVRITAARTFNKLANSSFTSGYTDCVKAVTLLMHGQTQGALDLLRSSLASQRRALDMPFATAPLAACYVWALYVTDDFDTVQLVLSEYREMLLKCAIPDFFAVGVLSAARCFRALHRDAEAHTLLSEAEVLCVQGRWPRIASLIRRERLFGASGSAAQKHGVLSDGPQHRFGIADQWMPCGELAMDPQLGYIRQAIRTRRFEEAAAEIARLHELHSESMFVSTQLGFGKALLLEARGLSMPAARQFSTALKMAHECGYVRMVIDEGKSIRQLLEGFLASTQAIGDTALRRFATDVLSRIQGGCPAAGLAASSVTVDLAAFSDREREIIECLRQRMSNREIADATSISENTVKFHLKKIFGKLGINRRSEAFAVISSIRSD